MRTPAQSSVFAAVALALFASAASGQTIYRYGAG